MKMELTKLVVKQKIEQLFAECRGNIVEKSYALSPEVIGLSMYEAPLVGIGSAKDPLFELYKEENVIGPWHMTPEEWLPESAAVISLFFPFSESVKKQSRKKTDEPSTMWLHSRIEGQKYIDDFMRSLSAWLETAGVKTCVPSIDQRFVFVENGKGISGYDCITENTFASNWSERHAAYVCGLGTFGLSKGLITEKGMAGRFASIIVDMEMEADVRPYQGLYDYCTKCGACIRRCPAHSISLEKGKIHKTCSDWLDETRITYAPRYGCGLCQTKVPCESGIPVKKSC